MGTLGGPQMLLAGLPMEDGLDAIKHNADPFVCLFSRFPAQQPLEICDEVLGFVAMQLNIDATGIADALICDRQKVS